MKWFIVFKENVSIQYEKIISISLKYIAKISFYLLIELESNNWNSKGFEWLFKSWFKILLNPSHLKSSDWNNFVQQIKNQLSWNNNNKKSLTTNLSS